MSLLTYSNTTSPTSQLDSPTAIDRFILISKGICFGLIIFSALFGNALVFIAILKFHRLRRIRTNIFLVSLAFADFLVALLAMPFNASMGLSNGRWIFGSLYCDIYNANDVLFSTASILHLCCISADRYIAILNPLNYERKMTRKRLTWMLILTWTLSFLISYIPILTGLHLPFENQTQTSPAFVEICEFKVNPYYAIVSSTISFWFPGFVMVVLYVRIYHEARKQEKKIFHLQPNPNPIKTKRSRPVLRAPNQTLSTPDLTRDIRFAKQTNSSPNRLCIGQTSSSELRNLSFSTHEDHVKQQQQQHQLKIRRESKAAKTLGIIMGAFLLCWLPFFLWYTTTNLCGGPQRCPYPEALQEFLFWIGYLNSTLNPIIYVFYNRTFRLAFAKVLECEQHSSDLGSGFDTWRTVPNRKSKLSQNCDRTMASASSSERGV